MAAASPVLIAGAGVAGLAFALECAHRGIACRIIERSPALDEVGAGIQLPPNAARLLARHGAALEAGLDARAVRPEALAFIDGTHGTVLTKMPLGDAAIRRWGAPARVLHRADLQQALLDAVKAAGMPVALGHALETAAHSADGVTAVIEGPDGGETVTAPLLIGADGIHSAVRRAMGGMEAPAFTGQIAWRALAPADALPPALRTRETGLWLGPGAHLVHYPISGGERVNIVAVTHGAPGGNRFDPRFFRGWSPAAQALVAAGEHWLGWPLYIRPASRPWVSGRMALLGDAAHAMLPHLAQGAAQAIEDAHALADSIAMFPGNQETALSHYEKIRKSRATRIQDTSRRNGGIYQMRSPFALARNLVLRRLPAERLMAQMDWVYGRHP